MRLAEPWLSGTSCNQLSTAAELVRLLAALVIVWLSLIEHRRTLRPSTLLTCFIFLDVLGDILSLVSYYNVTFDIFGSTTVTLLHACIGFVLFLVECSNKTHVLKPKYDNLPPDVLAGFYDRLFFWWVNRIVYEGSVKPLKDLPQLDETLSPSTLRKRILHVWNYDGQSETSGRSFLLSADTYS